METFRSAPVAGRVALIALLAGLTAIPHLVGCDDQSAAPADAGDLATEDAPTPAAFRMDTGCDRCHLLGELTALVGDDRLAAGRWLRMRGEGLMRYDLGAPVDGTTRYQLRWPRRGRHAGLDLPGCFDCHPVYADGRGHSLRVYPESARALAHASGGRGCADDCHVWLPEEQLARGLSNAQGTAPLVAVAGRPRALLEGADNAHAALWRDGFSAGRARPGLRIDIVAPGCGGCHNLGLEGHGEIVSCLECHDFGGVESGTHTKHLAAIESGRPTNDPAHPDRDPCLYCHDVNSPGSTLPDTVYRGVCYNCHLSGHQPMDADGRAHFWGL